jgi:hypothetical protein
MKMINTFRCWFMLMLCAISGAQAGGGLIPEEIASVVAQKPDLWAFLNATLDISERGWGVRIGSDENYTLAGTRILPYQLRAKPKGTEGPYIYELELHGSNTYFDKHGRKTTLKSAARVKLVFTGVSLRKLSREEQEQ